MKSLNNLTINEIKKLLNNNNLTPFFFKQCMNDDRKGVKKLLIDYRKKLNKNLEKINCFNKRIKIERSLWNKYPLIAGIDEVGRGALAGPIVSAAVILPHNFYNLDVNDSKKISKKNREKLFYVIYKSAISIGIGIVNSKIIDNENVYHATELCMKKAVNNLLKVPNYLLVDAMHISININQMSIVKGDGKSITIGAASIIAKVIRDHIMYFYDKKYPIYDFKNNVGYGTKKHLEAITKYGITNIHRNSFRPVNESKQLFLII